MKCEKCGKEFADDMLYCPYCGTKIQKEEMNEEQESASQETAVATIEERKEEIPQEKEKKVWRVFSKVGKVCGIVSLATSWIGYIGILVGIHGIVFSALGKKGTSDFSKRNGKVGLTLSIIGTAVSFVLYCTLKILKSVGYAIAAGSYFDELAKFINSLLEVKI